jgi:hypothetical protein
MYFTIVSICVNYTDILKISYYFNKQKNINRYNYHIITTESDNETIQFCKDNGLNYWATNAFYNKKSKFNKGAALNIFFEQYIKQKIDNLSWICMIDSDIIINDTLNDFLITVNNNNLQDFCVDTIDNNYNEYLYSCPRRIYNTPKHFKTSGFYTESVIDFIGYFQLFHISKIKNDLLSNRPIFFENSNASKYDDIFRDRYWSDRNKRKRLKGIVDHLGPIATNWYGRTSESWSDLHQYLK